METDREVAPPIDLDLPRKLQDRDFRQQFFLAESSALIAEQLIALRKRRDLSQKEVAEQTGTRQPAISRVEQADYQNWSFNTLQRIAEALDARIRVLIQASEDILSEYSNSSIDTEYTEQNDGSSAQGASALRDFFPMGQKFNAAANDDQISTTNEAISKQTRDGILLNVERQTA